MITLYDYTHKPVSVYHADGSKEDYASLEAAEDGLSQKYGEDVFACHDQDLSEGGDRTLVWETEHASENDDGQNAVATIRWA